MSSDSFRFKQFVVNQAQSAMKVGTDGVLVGAWALVCGGERRILDIGTGTGLIALMMAQRNQQAVVDAVEIEPRAAQEARRNFENSPWGSRLSVCNESFQDFAQQKKQDKYDLIISNPPYFNGTYKSTGAERTAARHVELLCSDDIIDGVVRILDPEKGRFAVIFPYEVGAVFIAKAASKGLYCNRIGNIIPKTGRHIKRIVTEFSMVRQPLVEQTITIANEDNSYTQEYIDLTRDFYLKF